MHYVTPVCSHRVTWLLERVTELASGESSHLSAAALTSANDIAEDYALLRPILNAMLHFPICPAQSNACGMERASSAPLAEAASVGPDPCKPKVLHHPMQQTAFINQLAVAALMAIAFAGVSSWGGSTCWEAVTCAALLYSASGLTWIRVPLQEDWCTGCTPLHSPKFNGYVQAGVGQVEAFALATCAPASAYFDSVMSAGLQSGPRTEFTAQLFVKEIWYTVRKATGVCQNKVLHEFGLPPSCCTSTLVRVVMLASVRVF